MSWLNIGAPDSCAQPVAMRVNHKTLRDNTVSSCL